MKIYNQTAIAMNNYQKNTVRKHNTTPNFKAWISIPGGLNPKELSPTLGKLFNKEKFTQLFAKAMTVLGLINAANNNNAITSEEKQKLNKYLKEHRFSHDDINNRKGEHRKGLFSTPLISACSDKAFDIVKILLKHPDININSKDFWCDTALTGAAYYDNTEIVKILLQNPKINVNIRGQHRNTALINASKHGYAESVKILLENPKINVNIRGQHRNTALINAAQYEYTEIVKMLLENPKININIKNEDGKTAMDYMPEIVQWKEKIDERRAKDLETLKQFKRFGFTDIDYYNLSTYEKVLDSVLSPKQKEKLFNEKQKCNEDSLLSYLAGNPFMQDENSQKRLEKILEKMEKLNINYNQKDRFGISALENIMYSSNIVFLRHYINKKATTDYSPNLDKAYKSIQSEEFKKLLDEHIYDVVNFKDVKEAIKSQSEKAMKAVNYQMHSPFFDMSHQVSPV